MNVTLCKKCMALNHELAVTCHDFKESLVDNNAATTTVNTDVVVNKARPINDELEQSGTTMINQRLVDLAAELSRTENRLLIAHNQGNSADINYFSGIIYRFEQEIVFLQKYLSILTSKGK